MERGAPESLDLGFAQVDLDRERRQGVPEVIYGAGKTAGQIVAIAGALHGRGQSPVLVTRLDAEKARAVAEGLGEGFSYFAEARLGRLGPARVPDGIGRVAVVCAGTSDLPGGEEAAQGGFPMLPVLVEDGEDGRAPAAGLQRQQIDVAAAGQRGDAELVPVFRQHAHGAAADGACAAQDGDAAREGKRVELADVRHDQAKKG